MRNKFVKSAIVTLGALMIAFIINLVLNFILSRVFNTYMFGSPAFRIILMGVDVLVKTVAVLAGFFVVGMLSGEKQPMGKVIILSLGSAIVTNVLLPIVFSFLAFPRILTSIISIVALYICILVGSMVFGLSE